MRLYTVLDFGYHDMPKLLSGYITFKRCHFLNLPLLLTAVLLFLILDFTHLVITSTLWMIIYQDFLVKASIVIATIWFQL